MRKSSRLLRVNHSPLFSFTSEEVFPLVLMRLHSHCCLTRCQVSVPLFKSLFVSVSAFYLFSFSSSYVFCDPRFEVFLKQSFFCWFFHVCPFSLQPRLSSSGSSPRPSHMHTSLLSLSIFSPLFHTTAVLFPPSFCLLCLSLSQIIAASLSVSCFFLRNLRGIALAVSLWTFFFYFAAF